MAIENERNSIRQRWERIKIPEKKILKSYEKELNDFVEWLGADNIVDKRSNQVFSILKKILEEEFNAQLKKAIVDRRTLNVTASSNGIPKIKNRSHYEKQGRDFLNVVLKRAEALNQVITQLETKIKITDNINKLKRMSAEIKTAKQYFKKNYLEIKQIINSYLPGTTTGIEEKEMLKIINTLIKEFAPFVDIAKMKGDLWEDVVALSVEKGVLMRKK